MRMRGGGAGGEGGRHRDVGWEHEVPCRKGSRGRRKDEVRYM
jgi:hypothetical protein